MENDNENRTNDRTSIFEKMADADRKKNQIENEAFNAFWAASSSDVDPLMNQEMARKVFIQGFNMGSSYSSGEMAKMIIDTMLKDKPRT